MDTKSPDDVTLAQKSQGSQNYNGWCQAFVEHVTNSQNHYPSAIAAWDNQENTRQPGIQGIKPGDIVYFSANKSNEGYGHTGIYSGQGNFISATNSGVKSSSLEDWMKATDQKVLGYVPQGNMEGNNSELTNNSQTSFLQSLDMLANTNSKKKISITGKVET